MSKVLEFRIAKISVGYVFGQQKEIDIPFPLNEQKLPLFPHEAMTLADWSAIRIRGELLWDKYYPNLVYSPEDSDDNESIPFRRVDIEIYGSTTQPAGLGVVGNSYYNGTISAFEVPSSESSAAYARGTVQVAANLSMLQQAIEQLRVMSNPELEVSLVGACFEEGVIRNRDNVLMLSLNLFEHEGALGTSADSRLDSYYKLKGREDEVEPSSPSQVEGQHSKLIGAIGESSNKLLDQNKLIIYMLFIILIGGGFIIGSIN
jgi:hypothetical protein